MISTPNELTANVLHKAIGRYYKELKEYESKGQTELNLRPAFQNLLAGMARRVNLTLVHEMAIRGRIRPDGVLVNNFNIRRGYWEAKGPKGNLEAEIEQKKRDGYPLDNALFENTRQAVLFQGGQRYDFNMQTMADVVAMLQRFLTYEKPETANFEHAVLDFKDQIPNIARRLLDLINEEYTRNAKFIAAFNAFHQLCAETLNPKISPDEIKEMLVQHLLTERLFRTVFDNPDFVNKNAIAAEIEKVIQALTSRSFNRREFLRSLDPFYGAIESAARGIETWSERQSFLNTVYERFFQGFAVQKADTLGIVYTPQEIVEFMVASVDEVLKREFGKSLATPGVKILDPCVGTGNFIVNIIKHIASQSRSALREKYAHDLFCNEISLLPYYIASMNVEHEYYEKMQEYVPFEGVCFVDTLELAEGQQLPLWVVEENTERIKREKDADIMVVIGNPPYNIGQKSENDNNKNRRYEVIDKHIKETYAKDSQATLNTKLYDAYVKFFRWAVDRLQGRDGIVCYISNNSFLDQIAFDGMRKHFLQDFTQIYHLDLHGNIHKNPKLSGTTHNVFGIQVGVGITLAIRSSHSSTRKLFYYRVSDHWRKEEKLIFLANKGSIREIEWQELQPTNKHIWITEGMHSEFTTFLPVGTKGAKASHHVELKTIFKTYSLGISTNRDKTVYDFEKKTLVGRIQQFIENYNTEIFHWIREGRPKNIDSFVRYDRIKWSRNLKRDLQNERYAQFNVNAIRRSLYRPFSQMWVYYSDIMIDERGTTATFFSNPVSEIENCVICLTDLGSEKPFMALATQAFPDLHLVGAGAGTQCFPYYTYSEDGSNRRENVTDWALAQFQVRYGEGVSKWDIFHYVYAMLHHPQYRERYAENLKRDLPHIPLLARVEAYQTAVRIGRSLMDLHVNYEQQEPYPLTPQEDPSVPFGQLYIVDKMRLTSDHTAIIVNKGLTLAGVPEACFRYRLGNRSALEWVIDQYQISKDARSGIVSDPNNSDDPEYIVRLVKQVVTVSVKTVELVDKLAEEVKQEDWLGETVREE